MLCHTSPFQYHNFSFPAISNISMMGVQIFEVGGHKHHLILGLEMNAW